MPQVSASIWMIFVTIRILIFWFFFLCTVIILKNVHLQSASRSHRSKHVYKFFITWDQGRILEARQRQYKVTKRRRVLAQKAAVYYLLNKEICQLHSLVCQERRRKRSGNGSRFALNNLAKKIKQRVRSWWWTVAVYLKYEEAAA